MNDNKTTKIKSHLFLLFITIFTIGCSSSFDLDSSKKDVITKINTGEKVAVISNDFVTESALHDAVLADDLELVIFLVNQGIDLNLQDQYGYTPLHLSVRLHNYDITKYLISKNADLNTLDEYKDTPLLDATRNNDTNISKILICNGANRNVADVHNMSTLNNSSKNNNKYISTLLRADHLEPYCQDELAININKTNNNEICGDILKGFVTNLKVNLTNEEFDEFGPYEANVDNIQHSWCLDISDKNLSIGSYSIDATGVDYVVNTANATKDPFIIEDDSNEAIDAIIKIKAPETFNDNTPLICGTIDKGDITDVNISLEDSKSISFGSYESVVDIDKKTWCAQVEDKLGNGVYTMYANGYGEDNLTASDINKTKIYIIKGLYQALMDEFEHDFEPWDAELTRDTLLFRFKNPTVLFKSGKKDLQERFKGILENFYPRYIKILLDYQHEIETVFVEGHASSEHRLGKTVEDKYRLNQILSQARAQEVLKYSKTLDAQEVVSNRVWINNSFDFIGKSSSQLIYNDDGTENRPKSRRVEFRIKTLDIIKEPELQEIVQEDLSKKNDIINTQDDELSIDESLENLEVEDQLTLDTLKLEEDNNSKKNTDEISEFEVDEEILNMSLTDED